ncbi:MAG: cobalamin-dependent protein [Proteobacteria bacterium]|nr:cobalamin-dependent protein [Pseudomonadota bacterium]
MDEQGLLAARILDSGTRALAAGAVLRQRERGAALPDEAFDDWCGEVEQHLRQLAEALAAARVELLVDHVEWTKVAYASRGLGWEVLAGALDALADELDEELPAPLAARSREFVEAARTAGERAPVTAGSLLAGPAPQVDRSRKFLLALLEAQTETAIGIVETALDEGLSAADVQQYVIAAAQTEMGRLWQANEVSVAEEHVGSRIVEDVLAAMRRRLPAPPEAGQRVIVASVEGDLHDIAGRMVADAFRWSGWNAIFLGASVPARDLALAMEDFKADVLALSVSLGLYVRTTHELLNELRERLGRRICVVVGGRPFIRVPDLWQVVGADASAATPDAAVRAAREALTAA